MVGLFCRGTRFSFLFAQQKRLEPPVRAVPARGRTVRESATVSGFPEPRRLQSTEPRPEGQLELQPRSRQQQQRGKQQPQRELSTEATHAEQGGERRRKLIQDLENEVRSTPFVLIESDPFPLGGRLRHFVEFWRKIASSREVISIVLGAKIPFTMLPVQDRIPPQCVFNAEETLQVRKMVSDLLEMDAIAPVNRESDQFVSQIFLVTNKDLSKRAILNVKKINDQYLPKKHFKMETLQTILPLIRKNDWFGSWDLRKGYFNVAVHPAHRKFFCFEFEGQRYQFKCLVMGLSLAPLFFTKLMAVLVQVARAWGINVSVYLDDSLTRGPSFESALRDHQCFGNLLQMAGFLLHDVKSVKEPVQRIEHLGFIIDSRTMMLEVPRSKEEKIRSAVTKLIKDIHRRKRVSIRRMASVIGLLVSVFPAVLYGKLHYRALERAKIAALAGSGKFERKCRWPRWCLDDLKWWRSSRPGWKCSFESRIPTITITTDASLQGWGAIWEGQQIFGPWEDESEGRIDELELLAGSKDINP